MIFVLPFRTYTLPGTSYWRLLKTTFIIIYFVLVKLSMPLLATHRQSSKVSN